MVIKKVCVFASSSNFLDEIYYEDARRLGEALGRNGYDMVYGGSNLGLMWACAEQAKKSHLPFLIFHGKEDKYVPTKCSVRLANELGDKARLVLFDGAAHAEAIFYNKELYKKELLDFLKAHMKNS